MKTLLMRVALSLILALAALQSAAGTAPGFGPYSYDGAGNIIAIGGDRFVYDEFGRLRSATLVQGTTTHSQELTYDRYGNILKIVTGGEPNPAVSAVNGATNRIDLPGPMTTVVGEYDDAGNLIRYNGGADRFSYDALNVMTESTVGTQRRLYLYTASNERIAILNMAGTTVASSTWTLRDASARVLRRFERNAAGAWRWDEDYIYRGAQLLAAEVPGNTLHFHLDHLGTPRIITGNGGARIAAHTYYPFGRELTSAVQDSEAKKFTGHERDAVNLDYMHARSYLPWTGRFLSVDPYLDIEQTMKNPQKWNRYAYVRNNPVRYTDPTGMDEDIGPETATIVNNSQQTVWIAFDADQMGPGGTNLDVRIPLKPGESSAKFTTDADAVIVAPGQKINGERGGAFKVRFGTVTVEGGKKGELKLQTNVVQKADPGQGHQQKPPQQWALRKEDVKNQEKTRQETARTKPERERRIKEREERKPWWRIF